MSSPSLLPVRGPKLTALLCLAAGSIACALLEQTALAAWVAYNDHAATNTTHVNATKWNVFNTAAGAPGSSGPLKNIVNGTNLPVSLTIATNSGGVAGAGAQANPNAGTPAYSVFNGLVDFAGAPYPSVELNSATAVVTYTFNGLNPTNRYAFVGSAVRGGNFLDRWTLAEIQNAQSFTAAHTAGVLTSNQVPALLASQAAFNSGENRVGDYVSWNDIRSVSGTFSIVCKQYIGTVPGGSSAGAKGFGLTAIRLEELPLTPTPLSILTQPANITTVEGQTTNLAVAVVGSNPRYYQWFSTNTPIANATNATLTFSNITRVQQGGYFVVVSNSVSSVTSSVAVVTVNRAQILYTLIGLTNQVWRYLDTGPAGGPSPIGGFMWSQPGYDDSAWPWGRGILAYEDNAAITPRMNTILSLTNGDGGRNITYYFRTHFTLTNKPDTISMTLSNIIDDGAVGYLNGAEVFRFNLPNGTITANTLASSASTENVFVTTNVSSSLLQQGDNVLAFEVHQNSTTSSDVVFGSIGIVTLLPPGPLTITNSPHDIVVLEGLPFQLQVGVTGALAEYQWFKDGNAIPGANSSTYEVTSASLSQSGVYLVVVSNSEFSAVSDFVQVFVKPDVEGPLLLEANGEASWTRTTLIFDRPLLPSTATNLANYTITNTFGEVLPISAVAQTNGTNVILQTAARRADANYIAVVNNVAGAGATHPVIVPNSSAPVRTRVQMCSYVDTWEFYDPYPPYDDLDPGASWNLIDHDTSTWGVGAGAFHWGNSVVDVPVNTTLSPSVALASYFRFPFHSSMSPAGIRMEMRALVNDGAVFYLNGQEFFRTNLPLGAADWNMPATATGPLYWWDKPVYLDPITFLAGTNLFAVELHQTVARDEKAFAAEFSVSFESLITGPVVLTGGPRDVTVLEGTRARLSASAVGAEWFQWQMDGTNIPGATNAALEFPNTSPSLEGRQFRLFAGNNQNSVWSTNATLHVLDDREAPRLLSAFAASDSPNAILLTFSRALSPDSALIASNYVVTNLSGVVMVVTNVTLLNGTNVLLSFAQPLAGNYFVGVNHLRDTTTLGNFSEPGSRASVGAIYAIPMNAAWKYLLINTNAAVEATFAGLSYDDSEWSGPSNALLYVEDAALPGLKSTLLTLTDASGNRFNTYYFRKAFWSAVGASNVTLRIRHIIDDGLVLYLNGVEIYRFNMPSGPVTASTQGLNVGDAILIGPIDQTNCTILAGTNILAAEVHQNGAVSSDVVFGVEINGMVPSVSFNSVVDTHLTGFRWGDRLALSWSNGAVLESASSVEGPWLPVSGAVKPWFISTNAPTTFFRLRP